MTTTQGQQKGIGRIVAAFITTVTLIGGCLAVAGYLGFKTDIFAKPTATPIPPQMNGQLSELSNDYDKTFGYWLALHSYPSDGYSEDELNEMGMIVNFQVRLVGFTGVWCHIQWSQYNSDSQQFVSLASENKWHLIQPEADDDQVNFDVWVAYPYPYTPGNYRVQVELVCPNRQNQYMKINDADIYYYLR